MMIVYWILAGLFLLVAGVNARGMFEGGHVELSISTIVAPVAWILTWSLALVAWARHQPRGTVKLAGEIVLATVSLLGAAFGGGATAINLMRYFNYGVSAPEVARDHYVWFAITGVLALVPGLILAGVVVVLILLVRQMRKHRTPNNEEQ